MKLAIDYSMKMAYVTGACHHDGTDFALKGIKKRLQDQAKADGYYGLEFWHFAEYKYPPIKRPGEFMFEILDPYGRFG